MSCFGPFLEIGPVTGVGTGAGAGTRASAGTGTGTRSTGGGPDAGAPFSLVLGGEVSEW